MASNQTENYGLNQWEAGDAVLHTDFNADNAKIDSALAALNTGLAGKAGVWKSIGQSSISSIGDSDSGFDASTVEFDRPNWVNIDWSEWEQVVGLGEFVAPEADSGDTILIEGLILEPKVELFTLYNLQMGNVILSFFPQHNPDGGVKGFVIGHGVSFFDSYYPYKNLKGIQFLIKSAEKHRINSYRFRFFGRG